MYLISYCSLLAIVCVQVTATAISYLLILLDIIQCKYCNYDLIKCMSTLSDQSYIASYTPAINLSINISFPFFRYEQDIVRQGTFEVIKFFGSPKLCKFVISVAFDFHGFYHTCSKMYVLYIPIYTWKLIFVFS